MEDFSITTRLAKKDYAKFLFVELYKKPMFIIATILGLYLITTVILHYLDIIGLYSEPPYYELIAGTFILTAPALIVLMAVKGFHSNPCLQHDIQYTFTEDGIGVKGITFEATYKWSHMIKYKETNKFLLLFSSKKLGNFIDKSTLSPEQTEYIKSRIGRS